MPKKRDKEMREVWRRQEQLREFPQRDPVLVFADNRLVEIRVRIAAN
jgi:hypothetical protein